MELYNRVLTENLWTLNAVNGATGIRCLWWGNECSESSRLEDSIYGGTRTRHFKLLLSA